MHGSHIRQSRGASVRLVVLLLALNIAAGFGADTRASSTNRLWQKIVMVGASASAGFTVLEPWGGTNTQGLRLSRYVDAALIAPHAPVLNLGNALFFLQPESTGRAQMTRALAEQPSVLFAVDFLFWFCYGQGTNDKERLQRLEGGLKLLEPVTCPLVLGDLPDASAAVNRMLRPDQIPGTNTLAAANLRLRAWAAARTNVALVPLAQFMHAVARNEALSVHGRSWPAGKSRRLLQPDNLHPDLEGAAALALVALEELRLQQKFPAQEVRWDVAALVKLVRAAPER